MKQLIIIVLILCSVFLAAASHAEQRVSMVAFDSTQLASLDSDVRGQLADVKKSEADTKIGKVFRDCPDCPDMVVIPAGSFDMGANRSDEGPIHRVTFAQPFAVGKTEVTQAQWRAVMGNNPSNFSECGDACPVDQISWKDAQEFIKSLNSKTGKHYRLPSEAEWEYACRAGKHQEFCGSDALDNVGWYSGFIGGNSERTTKPVASKKPNAFGLYDMSGNVWEWVEDSYHDNYNSAPNDGSAWDGNGEKYVLRGGSWSIGQGGARAAKRRSDEPEVRSISYGFRLVRTLP